MLNKKVVTVIAYGDDYFSERVYTAVVDAAGEGWILESVSNAVATTSFDGSQGETFVFSAILVFFRGDAPGNVANSGAGV